MYPAPTPKSAAQPPQAIPCASCQYNLAGLPDDGQCPECAHSIGDSLRAHQAKSQPPDEFSLSDVGYLVLILGCIGAGLTVVLGPLYVVGSGFGGRAIFPIGFLLLPVICVIAGAWTATMHPSDAARLPSSKQRIIARALTAAVLIIIAAPFATYFLVDHDVAKEGGLTMMTGCFSLLLYPMLSILIALHARDWRRLCKSAAQQSPNINPQTAIPPSP